MDHQTPQWSPPPPPGSQESQVRNWNMLCHLSALAGLMIPFGNILGPLVVWLIKKNEIPSTEVHGKASLNFQITATIALLGAFSISLVLAPFCLGLFLIPAVLVVAVAGYVYSVIAALKASNGENYKYPWSLELVK